MRFRKRKDVPTRDEMVAKYEKVARVLKKRNAS